MGTPHEQTGILNPKSPIFLSEVEHVEGGAGGSRAGRNQGLHPVKVRVPVSPGPAQHTKSLASSKPQTSS